MKIIDSSFKEHQDTNNTFNDIYNNTIEYLKTRIDNEQLLEQINANSIHSLIQLTDGNTYTILADDGKFRTNKYRDSSAAFKTNMAISVKEDEVYIIPGVALRPNYNIHQLVHEQLHAISSNQHNYFDESGIFYTKVGTKIDYYDKSMNDYNKENNPSSDGLNEGITEYLASIITNEYTGAYPPYVVIANLLMSCNNQLLNAYFSSDPKVLESFYDDLEEKQSIISRNDLCGLNSTNLQDDELLKIIIGAIKYNEAYNNSIDITEISNYLDRFYMLNSGSWSNLITAEMNNYDEYGKKGIF